MVRGPVTTPRSCVDPSPQLTTTRGVVPVAGVTVTLTGDPSTKPAAAVSSLSVNPAAAEDTVTLVAVLKVSPSVVAAAAIVYDPARW